MRFVIEKTAWPGTRFGPCAFAHQVGDRIPVEVASGRYEQGTIRGVEIVEDGLKARIEVELPDSEQVLAAFDTGIRADNVGLRHEQANPGSFESGQTISIADRLTPGVAGIADERAH